MVERLIHLLGRPVKSARGKILLIAGSLILVVAIGIVDYLSGYYVGLSILYVFPIMLVTMAVGTQAGVTIALAGTLTWLIAQLVTRAPTVSWLVPCWNAGLRLSFFLLVVAILDAWSKERTVARQDFLTGVANRQAFTEFAEWEMERSRRYRHPVTVAYLDCDGFKQLNDAFGHAAGDTALRTLADTLRRSVRKSDIVARLGGDEFAILMPETRAEVVPKMFRRLQQSVAAMARKHGWPLTISIGVATFTTPPGSVAELIHRADHLMYAAKSDGAKSKLAHGVFGAS